MQYYMRVASEKLGAGSVEKLFRLCVDGGDDAVFVRQVRGGGQ